MAGGIPQTRVGGPIRFFGGTIWPESSVGVPMGAILDRSSTLQSVAESQAPRAARLERVFAVAALPWTAPAGARPRVSNAGWSLVYLGFPQGRSDSYRRVFHLGAVLPYRGYEPHASYAGQYTSLGRIVPPLVEGDSYSDLRHGDVFSLSGAPGRSHAIPEWAATWVTNPTASSTRLHVLYVRTPRARAAAGAGDVVHAWSDDQGRSWSRATLRVPSPPAVTGKAMVSYLRPNARSGLHVYYLGRDGMVHHLWHHRDHGWNAEVVTTGGPRAPMKAMAGWWSDAHERHALAYVTQADELRVTTRVRGTWQDQRIEGYRRSIETLGLVALDSGQGGDVFWHTADGLIRAYEARGGIFSMQPRGGDPVGPSLQQLAGVPFVRSGRLVGWRAPQWIHAGNRGRQHLFGTTDGGDLLHVWYRDGGWHHQVLSLRDARHIRNDGVTPRAAPGVFPAFSGWTSASGTPSGSLLYVGDRGAVWEAVPSRRDEAFAQGRLQGGLSARSVSGTAGVPGGWTYAPLDADAGGAPIGGW